jgi:hypothetical protein
MSDHTERCSSDSIELTTFSKLVSWSSWTEAGSRLVQASFLWTQASWISCDSWPKNACASASVRKWPACAAASRSAQMVNAPE